MSIGYGECECCLGRVKQRGDHLCPPCAEELGRTVRQPFWGSFAGHPDAALHAQPTVHP